MLKESSHLHLDSALRLGSLVQHRDLNTVDDINPDLPIIRNIP